MTNKLRSHRLLAIAAIAILLLIMCAITAPLAQTPTEQPTEEYDIVKIDTNLVILNISVTDQKNHPITGLKSNDFLIKDEGATITPQFFHSERPASIVFIIDISGSMDGSKWHNLKTALKQFLKKQQDSNYTLIVFNETPLRLASSITPDAFWNLFRNLTPDGDTALYDGLLLGLDQTHYLLTDHKAIILLSDGEDNRSKSNLGLVQQKVFDTHTTIYAVGILSNTEIVSPKKPLKPGHQLLTDLASTTGGLSFFPTPEKIESTLIKITAEITNQYSFGYYPANKTPGWRTIEVDLLKSNLPRNTKLRYQNRYLFK